MGHKMNNTPFQKGNSNIFVVDDNPLHVELIERILKRKGYKVQTFPDAMSLLGHLKTEQPHMIISDIEMPEMNGFELYEEIKKMPEASSIPLLYISSKRDSSTTKKAKEIGAAGYIQKPFVPSSFLKTVDQKLNQYVY